MGADQNPVISVSFVLGMSPIRKKKGVLTCVTVLLPALLSFLAVSVEVTHSGRTHSATLAMTAAPQLGAGLSPVQQPGSLSTQRSRIRWKQHTNVEKCHPNGEKLQMIQ